MLNEEDKFMLKKKEIANVFNAYFDSVTDSFDLLSWFNQSDINNIDITKSIVKWLQNHPRLIQIKQIVSNQAKVSFQPSSFILSQKLWWDHLQIKWLLGRYQQKLYKKVDLLLNIRLVVSIKCFYLGNSQIL